MGMELGSRTTKKKKGFSLVRESISRRRGPLLCIRTRVSIHRRPQRPVLRKSGRVQGRTHLEFCGGRFPKLRLKPKSINQSRLHPLRCGVLDGSGPDPYPEGPLRRPGIRPSRTLLREMSHSSRVRRFRVVPRRRRKNRGEEARVSGRLFCAH